MRHPSPTTHQRSLAQLAGERAARPAKPSPGPSWSRRGRERACNTPRHARRSVVEIDHLKRRGRRRSAPQPRRGSGSGFLRPPHDKSTRL
eukprot:scaffold181459_cov19-Tisochrysis_lutea.AAC.1